MAGNRFSLKGLARGVFGSRNERVLKGMRKTVTRVNALEAQFAEFEPDQFVAKTAEFKDRLAQGETLENLIPEAFALVRAASQQVLDMRHFDVQLIGGMVLHEGKIAEMRTGEGKTLVATLSAYLNALPGAGVHIITVNDYLASRDAEWMGRIYHHLGMTTGVIVSELSPQQRRLAYAADITYGTNNEFGFDYLRDNMAISLGDRVQRDLNYAIVDEVDSILIDEARTPLIISGPTDDRADQYTAVDKLIPKLRPQLEEDGPGDYSLDEKARQVFLSEDGHQNIEESLTQTGLLPEDQSLYDAVNIGLMHHVNAALRAHILFKKDVEYIVKDGQVVIVDEFTGRTMPGRRWSEGLHQAVEAKEGVEIQNENQTLASITFQNYFRLYKKLAGMTGTADTEAGEFQQIYGLEVIVIPTHMPMVRDDQPDSVFLTATDKFDAIITDIQDSRDNGQPVLVGTASVQTSEYLSDLLKKRRLDHRVLNAKFHEKEAHIITQAGRPGAVTIATNMAGRGTDIVLGGSLDAELKDLGEEAGDAVIDRTKSDWQTRHQKVVESGGLHIIGTERHESRRIDNQLRGRSGRQGDPGSSRFFLSLEDNLMRIFASDRTAALMKRFGMQEGESIEHPWVTKAIGNAQRKVEGRNFDIRKELLEYDDVANDQRKVIYEQRSEIMGADDISENIKGIRHDVVHEVIDGFISPESMDETWELDGLTEALEHEFGQRLPLAEWLEHDESLHEESLRGKILQAIEEAYQEKEAQVGPEPMRHFEKVIMLQVLDTLWKDHLAAMDHLRQGIHLRGYAHKNPKQEYKREAFEMFERMLGQIKRQVVAILSQFQIRDDEDVEAVEQKRREAAVPMQLNHASVNTLEVDDPAEAASVGDDDERPQVPKTPYTRQQPKVGRNQPCPCGSGKKYKHCHGKLT